MAAIHDPGKKAKKRIRSASLAALFVAGVGAIAWFGTAGPGNPGPPRSSQTQTIAAAQPGVLAEEATRRVSQGGLPTRIVIGRAGIDTSIAEVGVIEVDGRPAWETAWRAAGHHLDSALPGQPGNMVISGHVSVADRSNVAVFRTLDTLIVGDVIEVYSGDTVFKYAVSRVSVVPPATVRLLRSDQDSLVTLVTCTRDLKNRLVVVGKLI